MIWIAWRYQRSVACALALLALVVIAFTVATGIVQHHYLVEYLGAPCRGSEQFIGRGDFCGHLDVKYTNIQSFDAYIRIAGAVIAPLVGAIFGLLALVNELDHRTVRLAWTQSISRTRWFAAKAGTGAAAVVIILVPTAIALSWWNGEVRYYDLFSPQTFGIAGWDLVAYGLFMFALTMLVGVIVRRVGWTLAAAIVFFLAVAIVVPKTVREHLVTPTVHWSSPYVRVTKGAPVNVTEPFPANSWLLVNGIMPRSTPGMPTWSDVLINQSKVTTCMAGYPEKTPIEQDKAQNKCYKTLHFELASVYIGSDQFWTLQLREGLLYLVSGMILTAGAWSIVRRIEP